jgi:hypothetical protein
LPTRPIGIVDSGCDSTTFPLEWAERLGIDPDVDCVPQEGSTAGGATTQFVYAPGVYVLLLGKKLLLGATFAPLCPHVLLGREDFFLYFKSISFDQVHEKLHLEGAPDWKAAAKAAEANIRRLGAAAEAHTKAAEDAVV